MAKKAKSVEDFWKRVLVAAINAESVKATKATDYSPLFAHLENPSAYAKPGITSYSALRNALRRNSWQWLFDVMRHDGGFMATILASMCEHEDVEEDLRMHIARSVGGLSGTVVDNRFSWRITDAHAAKTRLASFVRFTMNHGVETPRQLGYAAIAHGIAPACVARALVSHRKFMDRCGIRIDVGETVGEPVLGCAKMVWFDYNAGTIDWLHSHGEDGICGRPGQAVTGLHFEV